ncbi:hypothetical protein SERLADRAFT_412511 [Serpula lacrymans var. lacrymans S7.9]|uniref:F-box domain-containing protein n=1 Tax=Serpula lacrymans var. lacrymans (strain S7.9) TaxID=578457 RepID=F8NG59_SERL9|nr:uncharacterized protein SERLADRAFT_412511 [Serpula lacrymans var. lacrymans S7.9]EGO31029.1 hypothetical protein SERLADRAFT_412511 [Serpula lacrymans var. lacrymans S7.9]
MSDPQPPSQQLQQLEYPPAIHPVAGALAARQEVRLKQFLSSLSEPQPHDPDRSQHVRYVTSCYHSRIYEVEGYKNRVSPEARIKLESILSELRFDRNLIYWRLFRINDLPPEILITILRYVAWSTPIQKQGVKYRLWLTWVCRRWRSLMLGDSTLWSAIWFADPPPYARSMAWFERAGTAPLDLRINERDERWSSNEDDHRFTGEQMSDLLDMLFVKLSQIRMLIVIVDNWPPALVVLHKLQEAGRAGLEINITRFEIHRAGRPYVWIGPGYQPDTHRNPSVLFGGQTRMLDFLCLNGINIDWNQTPLTNLTTIDLRRLALDVSPSLAKFTQLLRDCPRLHKLSLDGAGPAPDARPLVHKPVNLLHLKILVLGDFSLVYLRYLLAQFTAPNVLDLTLMNMNGEDYSPLLAIITPMFREVRLLTLYAIEVGTIPQSKRLLVKWFDSMNRLGLMKLAQIKRHILEALLEDPQQYDEHLPGTTDSPRRVLCPNFTALEYQVVQADAVVALGQGRKELGVPLKRIYVNEVWVPKVRGEEQTALRTVADLFIAPLGANTVEELELME